MSTPQSGDDADVIVQTSKVMEFMDAALPYVYYMIRLLAAVGVVVYSSRASK
jgi:hypothetical protein